MSGAEGWLPESLSRTPMRKAPVRSIIPRSTTRKLFPVCGNTRGNKRMLARRAFLSAVSGLAFDGRGAAKPAGKIEEIEHKGVLIRECGLAGERRRDGAVPA